MQFEIVTWNVEGLESIMRHMPEPIFTSDVVVLTETFLTEEKPMRGYYSYHTLAIQGEAGRPSGGITCLLKSWLSPCSIVHRTYNTVVIKTKIFYIIGTYFQPECTEQFIIEEISEVLNKLETDKPLILAGDLNCRTDKRTQKATSVLEYLTEEGLKLINDPDEPTYICHNGTSTIDLILTSTTIKEISKQIVSKSNTSPLRKHLAVKATLSVSGLERKKDKSLVKIHRNLCKMTLQQSVLELRNMEDLIKDDEIDEAAKKMETIIKNAQIPKPQNDRKARPWFDNHCYEEKKSVLNLLHKARTTKQIGHLQAYACGRRKYKALIKNKKALYIEAEVSKTVAAATADPFLALKTQMPSLPHNIQMTTWQEHFNRIMNIGGRSEAYGPEEIKTREFPNITKEETERAISSLKNNKALGADAIYNEQMKESNDLISASLTQLYNKCIQIGRIPDSWRESIIKVLYKGKGKTDSPDSYRGIALENVMFKVFTKIIATRIAGIVDSKLPDFQFGFRRGHSTIHAIKNLMT